MNEEQFVNYSSRPDLRNPIMVCGLDGWINSGDVSVGGINFFLRQFKAVKFAEIPISRYHIYQIHGMQSLSPTFKMDDGLIVDTRFPRNEFYFVKNPISDHDLILFSGNEPNLKWEAFADTVVGVACDLGATRLYTLGGLLNVVPYTREPVMTCTCTSAKIKSEMAQYNVLFSNREGPATFNQMLLYACQKKDLDGAGFTVRVPYYPEFNIALGYSAVSIKAVLIRLNHLLHLNLDFTDLDLSIQELQNNLDSVRQQNPQFNTYIEKLEKEYVEMPYKEQFDISPSEAIKFAEEFLKEKKEPPEAK